MPREGQRSQKGSNRGLGGRFSSATWREQTFYLFDIVASLCAGFNEHHIEFLSSLLALLRGDLSAQRGGGTDEQTDVERNVKTTGQKRERGRKRRNCLGEIKVSSVKKKQRRREKWLFGRVKTKRDRRWTQPGLSPGRSEGRSSTPTCLTL